MAKTNTSGGFLGLSFLVAVWSVYFFWWSMEGKSLESIHIFSFEVCCNVMNVSFLIFIVFAWVSSFKQDAINAYIDRYMTEHDSISADHLAMQFKLRDARAKTYLELWVRSSGMPGKYNNVLWTFTKCLPVMEGRCPRCGAANPEHQEECVSCGAMMPQTWTEDTDTIDVEDYKKSDLEENRFCPTCGNPVTPRGEPPTSFCENCQKKV